MKNRWLGRAGFYGTTLTLCTTEEMFKAEHKRMTSSVCPPGLQWCLPGAACRHVMESPFSSMPAQIICIDAHHEDFKGDGIRAAAYLAHEVTHVKQETMRAIGEKNPSDEFEAYYIQNMMQNVLEEYARQMGLA